MPGSNAVICNNYYVVVYMVYRSVVIMLLHAYWVTTCSTIHSYMHRWSQFDTRPESKEHVILYRPLHLRVSQGYLCFPAQISLVLLH